MRASRSPLILALIAVLAFACDGDSPPPEATPEASATAAHPTSTPQPSPTPRSAPLPEPTADEIALIERVIALVRAGDEAGLKQLASGRFSPCEAQHSGPGGGPQCLESEAEGTPVESIGESICDGALVRLEDAQFLIEERDLPLEVAAYRPMIAGGDAGFFQVQFSGRFNMTLSVSDGRIGNIGRGCGSQPLVLGGRVAQWVIPPEYQPFAAEGAFVRVIDEPGDTDPFIWRFPVNRESGNGDYRVYGPSLPDTIEPGDRVCVQGWIDDVGNVAARRVTVVGDRACELQIAQSGIAIIDATIAAVYSKDLAKLHSLLQYWKMPCVAELAASAGPKCAAGEDVGTDVEAFSVGGCGGDKAVRRDEAERRVSELLIEEPLEIYAAHSSDEGGLWIYFQSPRDGRVVTVIAGDFIVGISQSCDRVTGEMTLGPSGGFIIPPQFER